MQEQGINEEPEPRRDDFGPSEQGWFPEDDSTLIRGVLRAARVRQEFRAELGALLHDKLVDHCLRAGMPDSPAAWLFKIACRECAKCEERRARLRRLEEVGANLVARCAHRGLTDERLARLRREVLDFAGVLPAYYRRTIDAALHSGDWDEFRRALGTDLYNASRALGRAIAALSRIRDAEE